MIETYYNGIVEKAALKFLDTALLPFFALIQVSSLLHLEPICYRFRQILFLSVDKDNLTLQLF